MINSKQLNIQLLKEEIKKILLENPEALVLLKEAPPGGRPRPGLWTLADILKYFRVRKLSDLKPDLRNYISAVVHGKHGPIPKRLLAKHPILKNIVSTTRALAIPVAQGGFLIAHTSWRVIVGFKNIWWNSGGKGWKKLRWGNIAVTQMMYTAWLLWLSENPEFSRRLERNYGIKGTEIGAFLPSQWLLSIAMAAGATVLPYSCLEIKSMGGFGVFIGGTCVGPRDDWIKSFHLPWLGQDLPARRCIRTVDKNTGKPIRWCGFSILSKETLQVLIEMFKDIPQRVLTKTKRVRQKLGDKAAEVYGTAVGTLDQAKREVKDVITDIAVKQCRTFLVAAGDSWTKVADIPRDKIVKMVKAGECSKSSSNNKKETPAEPKKEPKP